MELEISWFAQILEENHILDGLIFLYIFFIRLGLIWMFAGPSRSRPWDIGKPWSRIESGLLVWLSIFFSVLMSLWLQTLLERLGFISFFTGLLSSIHYF